MKIMPLQANTNVTETNVNPDNGLPDPVGVITLAPGTLAPGIDPNFFDLTLTNDLVALTPGLLANFSGGLRALDGDDYVSGGSDSEIINGNNGQDCLLGGAGNDLVRGGKDFDVISGGLGNDILSGNADNDYLYANDGNDLLRGGQGDDNLVGHLGNDTISGDRGVDKLWGSSGADVFVLSRQWAAPPQDLGTPQPGGNQDMVGEVADIKADFILDYNPQEGDAIALTGGLTPNDILLTERFIVLGDIRDYDPAGPYPLGGIRTADFRFEEVPVTVITEKTTGNILGLVRGSFSNQITVVNVSDEIMSLG